MQHKRAYLIPLAIVTALFFMWGALTALNDILIPHLKSVFQLNFTEAMLVQFCFFSAYFLVSVPAGQLVSRIGYQKGIVLGLLIAAIGCGLFYPAADMGIYAVFLLALFILASGITLLQVSANPYVTVIGPQETAASRLTLTQAFNSLGTTIAPALGSFLILSSSTSKPTEAAALDSFHQTQAQAVQLPYVVLASTLLLMAVIFAIIKLPVISASVQEGRSSLFTNFKGTLSRYPNLSMGALGIFLYVGAEVSIGSILVNYIAMDKIKGISEEAAGYYVTFYWMFAMIGRFIGAAVMLKIRPGAVLTVNSVAAITLIIVSIVSSGNIALWSILLVGLCNSIMFPTIFSLGVKDLGEHTSHGSGVLCMAIVGGAIIPVIYGVFADTIGIQLALILPALCYAYIAYYGKKNT